MASNNNDSEETKDLKERVRKLESRFNVGVGLAAGIGIAALASGAYTKYALDQVGDLAGQTSNLEEEVGGIDETISQAIGTIVDAQATAEGAISTALSGATASIKELANAVTNNISSESDGALENIEGSSTKAVTDIGSARVKALDEVASSVGNAVRDASRSEWDSVLSRLEKAEVNLLSAVVAFDRVSGCPNGWAKFEQAQGRFLLGVGKGPLNDTVDHLHTGGQEEVALTIQQMPRHSHTGWVGKEGYRAAMNEVHEQIHNAHAVRIGDTGGKADGSTEPHVNMPPYIALYFCKYEGAG